MTIGQGYIPERNLNTKEQPVEQFQTRLTGFMNCVVPVGVQSQGIHTVRTVRKVKLCSNYFS